jgi:copper chaperone NosL
VRRIAGALLAGLAACAGGPPAPAALDIGNEACAWCRMLVSDARFAAQRVAPGEEPRFFDDIGCLRDHLRALPPDPRAAAFVADHRTKAWIAAPAAAYARVPSLATPMGSHIVAHADAASRAQDPAAAGGTPLSASDVLGGWNGGPR